MKLNYPVIWDCGADFFSEAMDWFRSKKIKYIELSVDSKNIPGVEYWKSPEFSPYKFRMRKDLK